MHDDWFVINDIEEFVDKARIIVYNKFGKWNDDSVLDEILINISESSMDELDKILSHNEALVIIKPLLRTQKNKKTKKIRFLLNDNIFADIIQDLNTRMVSNLLTGLVNKGLVESSYDNETNDFVFWIKDENKTKPETD